MLAVFFAAFAPASALAGALEAVEAGALPAVDAGCDSHQYMIGDKGLSDLLWVPFVNLQDIQVMGLWKPSMSVVRARAELVCTDQKCYLYERALVGRGGGGRGKSVGIDAMGMTAAL